MEIETERQTTMYTVRPGVSERVVNRVKSHHSEKHGTHLTDLKARKIGEKYGYWVVAVVDFSEIGV